MGMLQQLLTGFKSCLFFLLLVTFLCCRFLLSSNGNGTDDVNYSLYQYQLGSSKHPFVSTESLFYIRLVFTLIAWSTSLFVLMTRTPLVITVLVRGQKVQRSTVHFERFTTFTIWSWCVICIYLTLATLNSYTVWKYHDDSNSEESAIAHYHLHPTILLISHVLYQISFSLAYLITIIVTFVLIPGAKMKNIPYSNFYTWVALVMHNFNVFIMMTELILNNIMFNMNHIPYMIIYIVLMGMVPLQR